MFAIGGTYTKKILHIEVSRIYIQPESEMYGKKYPSIEVITSNEQFGIDHSRCYQVINYKIAVQYFEWLTKFVNLTKDQKRNFKEFQFDPKIKVFNPYISE